MSAIASSDAAASGLWRLAVGGWRVLHTLRMDISDYLQVAYGLTADTVVLKALGVGGRLAHCHIVGQRGHVAALSEIGPRLFLR